MSSSAKPKMKRHKATGSIYHPDSKLVFRTTKDHTVIGRLEDNEVISLDEKAISLCEEYNLKYDESLVEEEEEEQQSGEEEDTEEIEEIDKEEEVESAEEEPEKVEEKSEEKSVPEETEEEVIPCVASSRNFSKLMEDISSYVSNLEKLNAKYSKDLTKVKCELKNKDDELSKCQKELTETKTKFKKALAVFQADL